MLFNAKINIMPLKELLDPQGKAINQVLNNNLGLTKIANIRIGKYITMQVEANTTEDAENMVKESCEKLLCNKVMEHFTFEITTSN
jgi:phosphoribosylformylglycinamidine synthase